MHVQTKAANGEELSRAKSVPSWVLSELGITSLPDGLIGLDIVNGLAEVIQTPEKPYVRMKLGKLLQQQGGTDTYVRETSQKLTELKVLCSSELKFTTTSDEVYDVYNRGPQSCMRNCEAVKAYATEDVAVAYLERAGKIIARSVVCINKELGLQYVCCYGFEEPLISMLEAAGFKEGDIGGCKLLLLHNEDGRIRLPYLDGDMHVNVYSNYLEVNCYGELRADSTDGLQRHTECENCSDDIIHEEDEYYSEHAEQTLCECCFNETHVSVDGETYHIESESITQLHNGEYILSGDAVYVEYRDEYHAKGDTMYNSYTEEYQLKEDLE